MASSRVRMAPLTSDGSVTGADCDPGSDQHLKRIAICGMLPPPVHGMSYMNFLVSTRARQLGAEVLSFQLAPPTTNGGRIQRGCMRILTFAKALRKFLPELLSSRPSVCYVGLSGGAGQWLELPFILLARLRGWTVVLHHHSFYYVDSFRWATRVLFSAAGPAAMHVVLSGTMGAILARRYRLQKLIAISNSSLLQVPVCSRHQRESATPTLGFLSNITLDKGIAEFLATVELVRQGGLTCDAIVAGPFATVEAQRLVESALKDRPYLRYVGPVYAADKEAFFDSVDILLFPTKYRNEAEPLTVLEALGRGLLVIANRRGCLPDLECAVSGLVVSPTGDAESFSAFAATRTLAWARKDFEQVRKTTSASYETFAHRESRKMSDFLTKILE